MDERSRATPARAVSKEIRELGMEPRGGRVIKAKALCTAFQPIVLLTTQGLSVYGYEALARDAAGRVPAKLLKSRGSQASYALDFRCRKQALADAVALDLCSNLSLNFLPGALCHPRFGLDATIDFARSIGFPVERLVVELTEREVVLDYRPIRECIDRHQKYGAKFALDDFGSGYNGLTTLLELSPEILKIDMRIVRAIETDDA
jgi:EAL domain-containing protein (putative c-di-GMP-specific phosphodiesterase class I)